MKKILLFVALVAFVGYAQESNCFKKVKLVVTSGKFRGKATQNYMDSESKELLFFTYMKGNTMYRGIYKVEKSVDFDFYLQTISTDTVTVDSSYVFDNSIFDPTPIIGVGQTKGDLQVGRWYYFDRFSKSLFAIVEYNALGQLDGRYTLFKNGKIFVDGNKVNNRNHGIFFGYYRGEINVYYSYDNGIYLGLYQQKKGKWIREESSLVNTYHYLF